MSSRKATLPKAKLSPAKKLLIICHNHPAFFPGGTEILAYEMFKSLEAGGQVTPTFLAATSRLSTGAHPGTAFQSHKGAGNEFLFWGETFDYFNQSQQNPASLHTQFADFLRHQQPDIVHFHHTLRFGVEALKVVRTTLPEAKIIYTLHDYIPICHRDGQMVRAGTEELCDNATPARCHQCFPERSAQQFKTRELWIRSHFDLVDQFIAPSKFLRERYIAWGIPADRITVVHNGIKATPPAPARAVAAKGNRDRFAFIGQISPYKGALLLLEAMKQLQRDEDSNIHLDIYGNIGLQQESFKEKFHELLEECEENVTFHGRYDNADLPKIMATADWVIMPSTWWENSPLVIDEALHHKRPVICSDIGGMAEKIKDGHNGLHFKTSNATSLADTMRRAAGDSGLWNKLVQNIAAPPTIAQCAQAHLALYNKLL